METFEEVYQIYFDTQLDCVVMRWSGYATSKQFRDGTELMLKALQEHKADKVFADIREMTLIGQEDQKWLDENFIPRAMQAGFQAMAIIRPKAYFNRVAVESVSYKVNSEKLRICFFDNRSEAEKWLSEFEV
jgi:ferredoxin-NADP reductase